MSKGHEKQLAMEDTKRPPKKLNVAKDKNVVPLW